MQYALPQFTDVEDRLIGPLTLKQFLILLATGGIGLFFYSLLSFSFFFFVVAAPFILLGVSMAFGTFNGRPIFSYFGALLNYISRPQARVFKREEPVINISFKQEKKAEKELIVEPAESRLRKLAYLLDQKTEEEKQLLGQ